jgi:hypothetical protein
VRQLLPALLLLAAPSLRAETPAPVAEAVDEREAMLRDLEYRTDNARSGRRNLHEALSEMRGDGMEQRVFMMGCQVTNQTVRIPEFFRYARKQVRKLEKPANYQALSPEQRGRLDSLKATLSTLEAEPDFDCAKIWEESPGPR